MNHILRRGPRGSFRLVLAVLLILTGIADAAPQSSACHPDWVPTFGQRPGTSSAVRATAVFDDGHGPALYVGGSFVQAGGVPADHVARWDGTTWSKLGDGLQWYAVHALAVFDDGSGPALYAGGNFTSSGDDELGYIARWDGSDWKPVGRGASGPVNTLAVFDDGSGPALYAGGWFTFTTGAQAACVAKWDGATWSAVGGGMSGSAHPAYDSVNAIAVFDDGTGPALVAGGTFTSAGGVAANNVAKWNGSSWSALGSGMTFDQPLVSVDAFAVFDDGTGPTLYAGGAFTSAGGVPAQRVARWNGAAWSSLGSGTNGAVKALTVFDDGFGAALYVGGEYMTTAGGVTVNGLAQWNGSSWLPLGMDAGSHVFALRGFDDGSGAALFAGGMFESAGGVHVSHVAKREGGTWSALGRSASAEVNAVVAFDDGHGHALFAGGDFTTVDGIRANYIARWDGISWSALGNGMNHRVEALAVFDDGTGAALYAGGLFTAASGVQSRGIARWNGTSWSSLAGGLEGAVYALAVHDDGTGPALYAGGIFTSPAGNIAQWDGTSWSTLGSGVNSSVDSLTSFDDGTGAVLVAGGGFWTAGGVTAVALARWNGTSWSDVGGGVGWGVEALASFDDGSGPALYVGGTFVAGTISVGNRIARWNGSSWSQVGFPHDWKVLALTVFDDGNGPVLCAGGGHLNAGNVPGNRVATWNGSTWTSLGQATNNEVYDLTTFDDGTGPALVACGNFSNVGESGDSFLARWYRCACEVGTTYCSGETGCPCGNDGPPGAGCLNSLGLGGRLRAVGCASLAADTVILAGSGMPNSSALYFQAMSQTSAAFGDGLRCAFSSVIRLATRQNVSGGSRYPEASDAPISQRGAITAPGLRNYQVWYRNAANFCTVGTFNLTNGLEIAWTL